MLTYVKLSIEAEWQAAEAGFPGALRFSQHPT
jgi:hypothetical protein